MKNRSYSALDHLIMNADQALRTLAGKPRVTERPDPAADWDEAELDHFQPSTGKDRRVRTTLVVRAQCGTPFFGMELHLFGAREAAAADPRRAPVGQQGRVVGREEQG